MADELIHTSAAPESRKPAGQEVKNKTFSDYFALSVTTFGVGFIPLAPGTWGSAVGVLIYLVFAGIEEKTNVFFYTEKLERNADYILDSRCKFTFIFILLSFGNLVGEPRNRAFQK